MNKKGYTAAKEKLLKKGTSMNYLKDHLRNLYLQNNRSLRAKSVDSIRKIKEEVSKVSPESEELLMRMTDDEMQMLIEEIKNEMDDMYTDMQVLAYEDETQHYLDQMVREDITCRRCGISSHKNINDQHKCFNCGFNIFNL